MHLSVFDIFKIGIGPSSSHTVGPMRAARRFAEHLVASELIATTAAVKVELFGSLGFTGKGHGSDVAVILGLEGEDPETVDVDAVPARVAAVARAGELHLLGRHRVELLPASAILFRRRETLPLHSNGMRFTARAADGVVLAEKIYYSIGGGFVVGADGVPDGAPALTEPPYRFATGEELLAIADDHGLSISTVVLRNECAVRPEAEVRARVLAIWAAMEASIRRGCEREGILPGGLKVRRRAAAIHRKLRTDARGRLRSAGGDRLGQPVRARGQRGERRRRPRRHRADQRRRRRHPRRGAVLPAASCPTPTTRARSGSS
jgi:L-serine dehydratase